MCHQFRKRRLVLAILLTVSAGQMQVSAARAQTVLQKEHCTGTLTSVVPGTLFFAGRGVATHFGKYTIVGSNDFDNEGNVLNGQFMTTIADGSTISGIYFGTYTPLASGRVRFDVRVLWLQGTGRLEGVTGEADVVAFLDGVSPGAAFEYLTRGTLTFP